MKNNLILEGKNYISASRAAKIINYAQDYVGQLCRAGKLDCRMVGRSWFVTEESLLAHRATTIEIKKDAVEEVKISPAPQEIQREIIREKEIVKKIEETPKLKYEVERAVLLPPLGKKVSPAFAIPSFHFDARKASTANTAFIILFIAAMGMSALIFSTSLGIPSGISSEASIASATRDIVDRAMGTVTQFVIDRLPENKKEKETEKSTEEGVKERIEVTEKTAEKQPEFNGIGIIPSTSPSVDEKEKNMIRNSFSDEVRINPDHSGTAGVITPVFKKTDGKDFVYVLVPVKDKKKQ